MEIEENEIQELYSFFEKEDLDLRLLIMTGWDITEFKINNINERDTKEKISNVMVLNKKSIFGKYVYEFKVHEEQDPLRLKYVADKEWTCQVSRRRVFSSSEFDNIKNKINEHKKNINKILSALKENKCKGEVFNTIRNKLCNRCNEIFSKKYHDNHYAEDSTLKELLTSSNGHISNAHKSLNFTKGIEAEKILSEIEKQKARFNENADVKGLLDCLEKEVNDLISKLNSISIQYLNDNGEWTTDISKGTHHVVRLPEFETTPGARYDRASRFTKNLYKLNRITNIESMYLAGCLFCQRLIDDLVNKYNMHPSDILNELKQEKVECFSGVDIINRVAKLSQFYKNGYNLEIEKILFQKSVDGSDEMTIDEFISLIYCITPSDPFYHVSQSLLDDYDNWQNVEFRPINEKIQLFLETKRQEKFYNQFLTLIGQKQQNNNGDSQDEEASKSGKNLQIDEGLLEERKLPIDSSNEQQELFSECRLKFKDVFLLVMLNNIKLTDIPNPKVIIESQNRNVQQHE